MAVACLQGNCLDAEMYPSRDKLVYWRAVHDGMPPIGPDGFKTDPSTFYRSKKDFEYVAREHLKACSSKRGELSGTKGIRGLFEAKTSFNLSRANTPDQVAMQNALAAGLSGKATMMRRSWDHDASFAGKAICELSALEGKALRFCNLSN